MHENIGYKLTFESAIIISNSSIGEWNQKVLPVIYTYTFMYSSHDCFKLFHHKIRLTHLRKKVYFIDQSCNFDHRQLLT